MVGQLLEKLLVFAPLALRHVHSLRLELIDGNLTFFESVSVFNTMDNLIILFITL